MSAGSAHPFARLLRRLSQRPLPSIAEEAPLPRQSHHAASSDPLAWRGFHQPCSQAHVIALNGPAISASLAPRPWIGLLYVTEGAICLMQDNQPYPCEAGGCLLVPERALHWQSTAFSVICVMAAAPYLSDLLQPMLPQPPRHADSPWPPLSPTPLHPQQGHEQAALIAALERTLQTMDDLAGSPSVLIDQLGLGEQLCRILALLAVPEARNAPAERVSAERVPADPHPSASESFDRKAFDSLIRYINANLDQPLNLTLLQNHSHYSRRALQYAFRQRLGCTATQWIRGQRLDQAHRLLGLASSSDSVASIAQACGYRSMSLFSIEFQQRFHIKPSVLLREARSSFNRTDDAGWNPAADQSSEF